MNWYGTIRQYVEKAWYSKGSSILNMIFNKKVDVLKSYEKGLTTAEEVLKVFDLDPDQEIERKRYDV